MKYYILLPIFLGLLIISACSPIPELRNEAFLDDTSLVSSDGCAAPCWQDLVPGQSTWDEAVAVISSDERLTNLDRTRNRETGEEVYTFNYQDGPQCCRIFTRDGNLLSSVFVLLKPQIVLSDVIARYGEPQFIQTDDLTEDQTFVSLVFSDIPMIVYVFAAGSESGEVTDQSEVIGALYQDPTEMQLLLESIDLYIWNGYGPLAELVAGDPQHTAVPDPDVTTNSDS